MTPIDRIVEAEERLARRCAHILGPSSAAADALSELEHRRAAGEDVLIFQDRSYWVVGPKPSQSCFSALARAVEGSRADEAK